MGWRAIATLGLAAAVASAWTWSSTSASIPPPSLTTVAPSTVYNFRSSTITIAGAGFVSIPTVAIGDLTLSDVRLVNSSTVTATVPSDFPGGAYDLRLTNPDSQSATLAGALKIERSGDGTLSPWRETSPLLAG